MNTTDIREGVTRVRHDDYGTGTVRRVDGQWLLVLFDDMGFATSVHVSDVKPGSTA